MRKEQSVECLCCGATRQAELRGGALSEPGECPRCGYVGWALAGDLSEVTRRALRERPPEMRRIFAIS